MKNKSLTCFHLEYTPVMAEYLIALHLFGVCVADMRGSHAASLSTMLFITPFTTIVSGQNLFLFIDYSKVHVPVFFLCLANSNPNFNKIKALNNIS